MKTSSAALSRLAVAAVLFLLREAQQFLLPLVLAGFLALLLSRPVNRLARSGMPRMLAALLMTAGFAGFVGVGLSQFLSPLENWLTKAPDALSVLQEHGASLQGRLERLTVTTQQMESLAKEVVGKTETSVKVEVDEGSPTKQAASYLAELLYSFLVTVLMLFFLLARGNVLVRRLVALGRTRTARRRAIRVARAVERDFYRFLVTITCVNAGLAVATAAMLSYLDVPDAWLWGVLAGVLNYAPYVGTIISASAITIAAALSQGTLLTILLPGLLYLAINGLEAGLLTPALLGESLSLNPLFVFLAIVFFGWLWGVAGMFVAVPMLVIIKVSATELGGSARLWGRVLTA